MCKETLIIIGHMAGITEDNGSLLATINVTPLVDVMLVLLVIFMITAPVLQVGVEVELPKSNTPPLRGKLEQIVVSIDKNQNIFIGAGNKVTLDELGKKLQQIMANRKDDSKTVFVKGDRRVPYGIVMKVIGKIYESGVDNVSLVNEPV